MLNFEAFSRYLDDEPKLQTIELSGIGPDGKYIRQWSASLSLEHEAAQYKKIERLLAELNVATIDDNVRLSILHKIRPTIQQVIGKLHQHYLHVPSLLNDEQQDYANQVSSLYYLSLLVYQGVINRTIDELQHKPGNRFTRLIRTTASPELRLLQSIYEQTSLYVNLLSEAAILYKKPPTLYWDQINELYLLSTHHNYATKHIIKKRHNRAISIQEYYCQACLLSLLQLSTYRRQDIVGIIKVLDEWSKKIQITDSLDPNVKVFVDLDSSEPPQYLTAATKTNPYSKDERCVFIDMSEFLEYLNQTIQVEPSITYMRSTRNNVLSNSQRLAKLAIDSVHPKIKPVANICNDNACLISGFNLIHYHIAGKSSLFNIIEYLQIPPRHQPIANTKPHDPEEIQQLFVDITEIGQTFCRLFWSASNSEEDRATIANFNLQVQSLIAIKRIDGDNGKNKQERRTTAYLNSLNPDILSRDTWELGVIRSIMLEDNAIDFEVQIIGTSATACGVRLENKDGRRQNFVPALLLAADEKLGSKTSLIVPNYHLRPHDKVVLRVANKKKLLKLDELLLKTDNVQQYTIKRIKI